MIEISFLRIFGLVLGTFFLIWSLKEKKNKYFFFSLKRFVGFGLIIFSIFPNLLIIPSEIFKIEHNGRLLVIIILSIIILFMVIFNFINKLSKIETNIEDLIVEKKINYLESQNFSADIVILIPSYNELDNLKLLLKKFPKKIDNYHLKVIVIDDASQDDTYDFVKSLNIICIKNFRNRGQGASLRIGYKLINNFNTKVVVTLDADNQHKVDELEYIVRPIIEDKADLVIGSRSLGKTYKSNFTRSAGLKIFNSLISFIVKQKITDCSSGYKAFNSQCLKKLVLSQNRYQSADAIINTYKNNFKIKEVPISILERKYGTTKKGNDLFYGIGFFFSILKSWLS